MSVRSGADLLGRDYMPERDGEQVRPVRLDPEQGHPRRRLGNQADTRLELEQELMTASTWREVETREGGVRMGPGQAVALRLYQDLG